MTDAVHTLEIKGLAKSFGSNRVITDLDLMVRKGEVQP